jgi:hypothetical protein
MSEYEITVLSRLAMLKSSNNTGKYFKQVAKTLKGKAKKLAYLIMYNNRKNEIVRSLLEWSDNELGVQQIG